MSKSKIIAFRQEDGIDLLEFLKSSSNELLFDLDICHSFKELGNKLAAGPDLIIASQQLIKNHGSLEEFLLMIETLIKFSGLTKIPKVGIGISKTTTKEDIKKIII